MARTPVKLGLSRDQLGSFLQDFEQIKQFEKLFGTVDTIENVELNDVRLSSDGALATANEALASISRIEQLLQLLATASVPENNNSVSTDYIDFHRNAPFVNTDGRAGWNLLDDTLDIGHANSVVQQVG